MNNQHRKSALRHSIVTIIASAALFGCLDGPPTVSSEPAAELPSVSPDPTPASAARSVEGAAPRSDLRDATPSYKACCTTFLCPTSELDFEWCTGNGGPTWGETRLACGAACGHVCNYATYCEGDVAGPSS